MANNQRKVNSILAAQNIIRKATNDNMEKGIYTSEQRSELSRRKELAELSRVKNEEAYNPYPDHVLGHGCRQQDPS